jgi:hypothetical protein
MKTEAEKKEQEKIDRKEALKEHELQRSLLVHTFSYQESHTNLFIATINRTDDKRIHNHSDYTPYTPWKYRGPPLNKTLMILLLNFVRLKK